MIKKCRPSFDDQILVIWPCYTLIEGYTLIRKTRVLETLTMLEGTYIYCFFSYNKKYYIDIFS